MYVCTSPQRLHETIHFKNYISDLKRLNHLVKYLRATASDRVNDKSIDQTSDSRKAQRMNTKRILIAIWIGVVVQQQ